MVLPEITAPQAIQALPVPMALLGIWGQLGPGDQEGQWDQEDPPETRDGLEYGDQEEAQGTLEL